jgi:choice-of-anchor A domain-containing protein
MFSALARGTDRRALGRSLPRRQTRLSVQSLEARDVPATGLGVANDYSAFVLHDANLFNSDVEGRVAVGGNATITAYAVGDHVTNSNGTRDDLIVGGNLNASNGQVFFGNVVYGGTGTVADNFGHPNGTVRQQAGVIDFAAAESSLDALSDSYAGMAATGTLVNQFGTIILNGHAGTNVFNVPASTLATANDLRINAPAGATVIVNVTGTTAQMQFMGYHLLGGIDKDGVILNFPQATSVTFQGIGIFGNVLAPRAAVNFSNGQINGALVASSWTGYGQVNFPQQPQTPPPPPPCGCPAPSPSQISGLVYWDENTDGLPQDTEFRLNNVTVTLTGTDTGGHAVTQTATTDQGGIYRFDTVPAGTYQIQVTTPSGFTAGGSTVGAFGGNAQPNLTTNIVIPAGQSSGAYNFGELKPGSPCGCGSQPMSTSMVSPLAATQTTAPSTQVAAPVQTDGLVSASGPSTVAAPRMTASLVSHSAPTMTPAAKPKTPVKPHPKPAPLYRFIRHL